MPYNGYTSWTRWNVALWIYNDEGLYSIVKKARDNNLTIHETADAILQSLRDANIKRTPDGAKFSRAAVIEALHAWM